MKTKKFIILLFFILWIINIYAIEKLSEGMKAFKNGDYARAEKIFKSNLDNNPNLFFVYPNLINALYYQGKYGEALFYIEKLRKFKNKIARQQFDNIKTEIYAKILIENKKYDKAIEILNKGIPHEKDPIIHNTLVELKFLALISKKDYTAVEKFLTSLKGWDKNPLYLFYYGKLKLVEGNLNDYYVYIGKSWKESINEKNVPLKNQIRDDILNYLKSLNDNKKILLFINGLNSAGIDFPELQNKKNEMERSLVINERERALKIYIASGNYKKSMQVIKELKNKYNVDTEKYEEQIKKMKMKKIIIFGVVIVGFILIILIVIIVLNAKKSVKPIQQVKIQKNPEDVQVNTDHSSDLVEEADVKVEGEQLESEKIENEEKDIAKTEVNEIKTEEKVDRENIEEKNNLEEKEIATNNQEIKEKNNKKKSEYLDILKEYREILDKMNLEEERNFIKKYEDDKILLKILKIFHFFQIEKYKKVLALLKDLEKAYFIYLKDFVEEIEKECNTIEKAGICYLYYKSIGDVEKKTKYLELGKKFKDEEKS